MQSKGVTIKGNNQQNYIAESIDKLDLDDEDEPNTNAVAQSNRNFNGDVNVTLGIGNITVD